MFSLPRRKRNGVTTSADSSRHVPIGVIEDYLVQDLDGVIGVPGSPTGRLLIDPHHKTLAVQFPAGVRAPNVAELENLRFEVISDNNVVWHQIAIGLDDNLDEVYALLCAVLDRVQLSGEPFADAVEGALDSLTGILAVRHSLTREKQIGLFGELCVLLALTGSLGADDAMSAWRGPLGEEHDFGMSDADLEVKTTLSERREHWISTATQLVPTGGRPLYLVSIQLTAAAVDAGHTLPSLVSLTRSKLAAHVMQLDEVLARLAYRDRDSDLYHSRWALRTRPAFYEVGPHFPAVTQARLEAVVPAAERITDLRYRLDLTGLSPSPTLFAVDDV
jgi:hypothetical protein